MRISKKAEYALRALVAIARRSRSFQIHELSLQENIPVKFLEQILLALRRTGMLTSKRGVGGGYALGLAASKISVSEVIRAMDGPIAPVPCAAAQPNERCSCPDVQNCAVRLMMTEVREDIEAKLDSRSIEDLIRMTAGRDVLAFEI